MNSRIIIPFRDQGSNKEVKLVPGGKDTISAYDIISTFGPEYGYDVNYSTNLSSKNYNQLYLTSFKSDDGTEDDIIEFLSSVKNIVGFDHLLKVKTIHNFFDIINDTFSASNKVLSQNDEFVRNFENVIMHSVNIDDIINNSINENNFHTKLLQSFPINSSMSFKIKGKYFKIVKERGQTDINILSRETVNKIKNLLKLGKKITFGKDDFWSFKVSNYTIEILDKEFVDSKRKDDTEKTLYYFNKSELFNQISKSSRNDRAFLFLLFQCIFRDIAKHSFNSSINSSFLNLENGIYNLFESKEETITKTKIVKRVEMSNDVIKNTYSSLRQMYQYFTRDEIEVVKELSNFLSYNDLIRNVNGTFEINNTYPISKAEGGGFYPALSGPPNSVNNLYSRWITSITIDNVITELSREPGLGNIYTDDSNSFKQWMINYNNWLNLKSVDSYHFHERLPFFNLVSGDDIWSGNDKTIINYLLNTRYSSYIGKCMKTMKDEGFLFIKDFNSETYNNKVEIVGTRIKRSNLYYNNQIDKVNAPIFLEIEFRLTYMSLGRSTRYFNFYGYIQPSYVSLYFGGFNNTKFESQRVISVRNIGENYEETIIHKPILDKSFSNICFCLSINESIATTSNEYLGLVNGINYKTIIPEFNINNLIDSIDYSIRSSHLTQSNQLIYVKEFLAKLIEKGYGVNVDQVSFDLKKFSNVRYLIGDVFRVGKHYGLLTCTSTSKKLISDYMSEYAISNEEFGLQNEFIKDDLNGSTFLKVEKNKISVKKDIIRNINQIVNLNHYFINKTNLSKDNNFYYSFHVREKDKIIIEKNFSVDENLDDLMDDVDALFEPSAMNELLISFVFEDINRRNVFNLNNDQFIQSSLKLNNFEPFSDEMVDYVNSVEFVNDFTINNELWIDTIGFSQFINDRNTAIDFKVLDTVSEVILGTNQDLTKIVNNMSNIMNINPHENVSAQKGQEVAQAHDAFNKINDGINDISNVDVNDFQSAIIIKNRLSNRLSPFDISLGDPNIILADWKFRMLNNFADMKIQHTGNNPSYERFNDLIENLSIPIPDFSKIGKIFESIVKGIGKVIEATASAAANAMAIFDNLYNIINVIRFPIKVKKPVLNYNPLKREYDVYFLLPHGTDFNPSIYSLESDNLGKTLQRSRVNDSKVRVCQVYLPEINHFARCVILSIKRRDIDDFLKFSKEIVNNRKLSDVSKFVSLINFKYYNLWMNIYSSEYAWIGSLITTQTLTAAGSAFLSGRDPISGAISAAVSAFAVIGVNSWSSYNISSQTNSEYVDWFIHNNDDEDVYGREIKDNLVLICSIRNISAIPMTALYIAGSILVEVVKIIGGFAISTLMGAAVGHVVRKIQNSFKLKARRRQYLKQKKNLIKEMDVEIKSINEEKLRNTEFKNLSDKEWSEISSDVVKQQKEKVKLKYNGMDNGIINMNKSQLRGMADYNLFLNNNGILNSNLGNKVVDISKKQMVGVAVAAGAATSGTLGLINKVTTSVKDRLNKKIKEDIDEKESGLIGL